MVIIFILFKCGYKYEIQIFAKFFLDSLRIGYFSAKH